MESAAQPTMVGVTPQYAEALLAKNYEMNRKLAVNGPRVRQYASDMADGRWDPSAADFIRIAGDGTLVDGQHRLAAVVQCGRTVPMWVLYGVDKTCFTKVDTGKPRVARDFVKRKYGHTISSGIKTIMSYAESGVFVNKSCFSNEAVYQFDQEWGTVLAELARPANVFRKKYGYAPSVIIAFVFIVSVCDAERSEHFLEWLMQDPPQTRLVSAFQSYALRSCNQFKRDSRGNTWAVMCYMWRRYITQTNLDTDRIPGGGIKSGRIDGIDADTLARALNKYQQASR